MTKVIKEETRTLVITRGIQGLPGSGEGGGVTDHGALTGLSDDDHTQYHNNTRGDARYYTKTLLDAGQLDSRYYTETEVDAALSGKANTSHTHAISDVTNLQTALDGKATSTQGAKADTALQPADIGSTVQGYDANTVKSNTTKALSAGYSATVYDAGTKSTGTFTPDEANGAMQKAVNGGAHTFAPPSNSCTLVVKYTNNDSAGAITTSGFTKVTGDTPTTTNGHIFLFFVTKHETSSHLFVQAMQ